MTRQEANVIIIRRIAEEIVKQPDMRFGQILINLDLTKHTIIRDELDDDCDPEDCLNFNTLDYYEESVVTLERINKGESIDE